jgi:DNA-directed RNA polymerase specialized sigma24 family protein
MLDTLVESPRVAERRAKSAPARTVRYDRRGLSLALDAVVAHRSVALVDAELRRAAPTSAPGSFAMHDIVAALDVLPDDERALLTYHFVLNLDLIAIARLLNLGLGEAKEGLQRAHIHFAETLAFVTADSGAPGP